MIEDSLEPIVHTTITFLYTRPTVLRLTDTTKGSLMSAELRDATKQHDALHHIDAIRLSFCVQERFTPNYIIFHQYVFTSISNNITFLPKKHHFDSPDECSNEKSPNERSNI